MKQVFPRSSLSDVNESSLPLSRDGRERPSRSFWQKALVVSAWVIGLFSVMGWFSHTLLEALLFQADWLAGLR